MNKDKLISLIIRKQTYKDTRSYLNDLQNLKYVKSSYEAIKQILTTDYKAQAKLYSLRYLKDAFQKGNPSFINLIQKNILPILINISIDQNDQKSIIKYAGSSYTKNQQLTQFKTIVSSLFRIVKECIIKWAQWIPDTNRKFIYAKEEIQKKKVSLNFQWKYFNIENQKLFRENCQKNGFKINISSKKSSPIIQNTSALKKKSKNPLKIQIQQTLNKINSILNLKDLLKIQNDFNQAINNYMENADNFDQIFVQQSFDQFEKLKKQMENKLKEGGAGAGGGKQKMNEHKITPGGEINIKQNSVKKIEGNNGYKNKIKQQKKQIESIKIQDKKSLVQDKKIQIKNSIKQQKKQINLIKQQNIKSSASKTQIKHNNNKILKQQNKQQFILSQQKLRDNNNNNKIIKQQKKINKNNIQQQNIKKTNKLIQIQQSKKIPQVKITSPKSSKIPNSPKAPPIKFQSQSQSDFLSNQASLAKQQQKNESIKKQIKQTIQKKDPKSEMSLQQQRINFSDEEQSQFSQDVQNKLQPKNFKKSKLTPIKQQKSLGIIQQKSPQIKNIKSNINEQQSFTSRDRRGGITHKLIQQNKFLIQKNEKLINQYQLLKQQKQQLLQSKKIIQKQLKLKCQNQNKLNKKYKNYIPIQDYNKLRIQLQQERQKRQILIKQNLKINNKMQSLILQLNQIKYKLNNQNQNNKNKQKINSSISIQSNKNIINIPIIKQEIDQDYIKNLTHTSNLHKWLNKTNLTIFKKNIFQLSQIAYRDDYLSVISKYSVYTQNNQQFLSINLTYQFKSLKQIKPQIKYKNCQQLDIWTKPLTGQQDLYTQQLAIRLHSNPLKVIKVQMKIIQGINITFLLPIIYYNFLRYEQFSNEQFDDIFNIKSQQLLKSKISQWNIQMIKDISQIQKIFKNSILSQQKIRFCLSQGINDQIFMGQFQILRNNKFLIRILPIPYTDMMITKAKQLIQNIIFLLS